MSIVDVFSSGSDKYATFRPRYPEALFAALASLCERREVAWDVGSGSGQAIDGLRRHFGFVAATDASFNQLEQGARIDGVSLACCRAETSPLESSTVDFIAIAQALHWFDLGAFFAEAQRVARGRAVIAAWTYGLVSASPDVDRLIAHLYWDVTGPYWALNRKLVDDGYAGCEWPFDEVAFPAVEMSAEWTADHLVGYLRTWSAVHTMKKQTGRDAVGEVEAELREAFGEGPRRVTWPLRGRVGRT